MRWLWRFCVIVLLLLILMNTTKSDEQIYINWSQKLEHLQEVLQDLPANIEVQLRKIWNDTELPADAQVI